MLVENMIWYILCGVSCLVTGNVRTHALQDPSLYVVFWDPTPTMISVPAWSPMVCKTAVQSLYKDPTRPLVDILLGTVFLYMALV